jgi:hypothetical protein
MSRRESRMRGVTKIGTMRHCIRISRWSSARQASSIRVRRRWHGESPLHTTIQFTFIHNVTNAVINAILYTVVLKSLMPSRIAQPTLSPDVIVSFSVFQVVILAEPTIVKINAKMPRAYPMEFRGFLLAEWGTGSDAAGSSLGLWG